MVDGRGPGARQAGERGRPARFRPPRPLSLTLTGGDARGPSVTPSQPSPLVEHPFFAAIPFVSCCLNFSATFARSPVSCSSEGHDMKSNIIPLHPTDHRCVPFSSANLARFAEDHAVADAVILLWLSGWSICAVALCLAQALPTALS